MRFDGRFYEIVESQIGPKPVQAGGPPILAGAATPAGIERAARAGVGLNPIAFDLDGLEQTVAEFCRAAGAAGHDASTLPVVVRVNGSITEKPLDERGPLVGSADQVAADLPRLEAIGVDEVFWSMDTDPADHVPAMERLLAAI